MSSKGSAAGGNKSSGGSSQGSAGKSGGNQSSASASSYAHEPQVVSGWEHSRYAHANPDRYAYMGKEDGQPTWVDYGGKGQQAGKK